jgi:prepilin-type N-terminal cleavage/methylation domain-containing protein
MSEQTNRQTSIFLKAMDVRVMVGLWRRWMKRKCSSRGFSLIEILIVVVVSVVMTTLLIVANTSTRDYLTIHVESAKFAQVVLRAKAAALSATDPLLVASTSFGSFVPTCGYGVHIDPTRSNYFLYRYGNPSSTVNCKEQVAVIDPTDPTYAAIGGVHTLPPAVVFQSGDPDEMTDVFYVPPYPTTFIGASSFGPMTSSTGAVGSVILMQSSTSATAPLSVRITVTGTGQVNY